MPIPSHGWKPMNTAPQDGKPFIALYDEFGQSNGAEAMQPVWWMVDSKGKSFGWKKFGTMDTTAHCKGWMLPHELLLCMAEQQMAIHRELRDKAAPAVEEFDL
jgi:hypothetical protein